jgi:hypothetical protein
MYLSKFTELPLFKQKGNSRKRRWACKQHVTKYITLKEEKPWNETGNKILQEDEIGKN